MKHIKIILGLVLFASVSTFAQSPRIKLNQITKDSLTGSVLISSPTDSGMVYSRDLFISYGADTVLILGGDTLAATSGTISSVLSDGVTITGDGTLGSELTVDTATVIATKQDLDLKQDQLNGTGFVKASGTTISYDNSTYLTSEVDGSVTNEGSLTVGAGGANDAVVSSNTSGSSDVTISGGTNVTVTESGQTITISATGGGTTYNNISETADTVYISDYLDVDTATLYVDATNNRVGIGTSTPGHTLHINRNVTDTIRVLLIGDTPTYPDRNSVFDIGGTHSLNSNGGIAYITPVIQNTSTGSVFNWVMYPKLDLQSNLTVYYQGLNIAEIKTNGYTLTDLSNAFYRNDFIDNTGAVTNSTVVDVHSPYIASGAIKPTNQYGFRIRNQGVSGITTSYGLYIDTQSGATNSYPLYIENFTSGTLSASGGYITASSDQRLKNEDGLVEDGIEKINQLIPRYFYWKDQEMGLNRQIGFFAQEVNAVIPEAAPTPNESEYWGLYDRGLIAVSIKAIQEQQAIIESQANEIEQLKTLITELSNRLTILENN